MKISELRSNFKKGEYTKAQFLDLLLDNFKVLFEFSDELKDTDIAKISITDEGLFYTSREHNITFYSPFPDRGMAPISMFGLGGYEQIEADMCLSLVKPSFNIFDVGANVGWFSMLIAKNHPTVTVNSFEPIKQTYQILNRNLDINNLKMVNTYNFGLYSENTTLTFFYDSECSGRSSAVNLAKTDVGKIECELRTMDSFVAENHVQKLDFLKCDVEGAELFVIKGGINSIERLKPIIFCEMLRKWAAKYNYHPNDIINILTDIGYSCFVIDGKYLEPFSLMDENTKQTNFFFLHDEKHAEIKKEKRKN